MNLRAPLPLPVSAGGEGFLGLGWIQQIECVAMAFLTFSLNLQTSEGIRLVEATGPGTSGQPD